MSPLKPGDRMRLHNGQAGMDCATLIERLPFAGDVDATGVEVWVVVYDREPGQRQVRGVRLADADSRRCPDASRKETVGEPL